MANELKYANETGDTYYVRVYSGTGTLWNGSAFEAYAAGNIGDYGVALSDTAQPGLYLGDFPAGISAGTYFLAVYKQAGGSQATNDTTSSSVGRIVWDGTNEVVFDRDDDWTDAEKAQIRYMIGIDGTATKPSTNKQHIVKAIRTRRRW